MNEREEKRLSIACIGDSLSTGFELCGNPLSTMLSARLRNNHGWFNSPVPQVRSLASILMRRFHVFSSNFSTVSAHAAPVATWSMSDVLLGTSNLLEQVRLMLGRRLPYDLVLMWIGHNDLNFAAYPDKPIEQITYETYNAIVGAATAIQRAYRHLPRRTSVVVLGLIGFEKFLLGRDEAMRIRFQDPHAFPSFELCYDVFPSMAAEHREQLIKAGLNINNELKKRIDEFDSSGNCKIFYSDAFQELRISRAKYLSKVDAWHPGPLGRRALARAAYPITHKAIDWVAHSSS